MHDRDPTVSVRVLTAIPLLQAALEHAVTAAGLRRVSHGEAAATLRTADRPAVGAKVDISVDLGQVTITLTGPPSPDIWAATFKLVRQLLDGTGKVGPPRSARTSGDRSIGSPADAQTAGGRHSDPLKTGSSTLEREPLLP